MTVSEQQNQPQENKTNDKELNFRALEDKYKKQLEAERSARIEAERKAQEAILRKQQQTEDEEEDSSDPYVDHKNLNRKLNKFGQNTQSEIQKAMENAKLAAKEEMKQEMFLENNPDFFDVLGHAEKFAQKAPKLAESILRMPEGFERQKLVYQTIKEMGIDKPEVKQSSVQDKIDANKRSPYYQSSGVGTAPYASVGDFTPQGQKQAYQKMQELKKQLRI